MGPLNVLFRLCNSKYTLFSRSRIIKPFFHVKVSLFAWLLAGSWQSHEVVSRFCKQVILRSFSLTTTAASCSTIIWPLITSNSTLLGQNHKIVGRLYPPAAALLLTDRRWKTHSHESAWLPPGTIRGVSAKLQDSKGKIRRNSSSPKPQYWRFILWQDQSIIMWRADLRGTLQNLLMRRGFVSVMPLSCDLLSRGRSLTDETVSATLLSERSYTLRLVSKWLIDSRGHDGWDIKLCTVQRI